MRSVSLCCLALAAWSAQAQHAHQHGVGELNVAIQGSAADVELRAPADSITGFEHQARTPAEKAREQKAVVTLRSKFAQMLLFDRNRECQVTSVEVRVESASAHGDHDKAGHNKAGRKGHASPHREFLATYKVSCRTPLQPGTIGFAFTRFFPSLERLKVQVIGDNLQTGAEIVRDKGTVPLGR